jgi:hypothetical protein
MELAEALRFQPPGAGSADLTTVYLDLVRFYVRGNGEVPEGTRFDEAACRALLDEAAEHFEPYLAAQGLTLDEVIRATPGQLAIALNHMHHDSQRLTISSDERIDNVLELARVLIDESVPGDFIETGAWRGGMTIMMRAALNAFGDDTRHVWVADSFQGLPEPDPDTDLRDAIGARLMRAVESLSTDLDAVRAAFARVGLLDARVRFLPGWFHETLPCAPIERLALMRLDGDWYESTRTALETLYPKLSPGGYVIIDDYGLPTGCARAVDEYRARGGIDVPLECVDRHVVFWRKPWGAA